jgi:hypothetical protein
VGASSAARHPTFPLKFHEERAFRPAKKGAGDSFEYEERSTSQQHITLKSVQDVDQLLIEFEKQRADRESRLRQGEFTRHIIDARYGEDFNLCNQCHNDSSRCQCYCHCCGQWRGGCPAICQRYCAHCNAPKAICESGMFDLAFSILPEIIAGQDDQHNFRAELRSEAAAALGIHPLQASVSKLKFDPTTSHLHCSVHFISCKDASRILGLSNDLCVLGASLSHYSPQNVETLRAQIIARSVKTATTRERPPLRFKTKCACHTKAELVAAFEKQSQSCKSRLRQGNNFSRLAATVRREADSSESGTCLSCDNLPDKCECTCPGCHRLMESCSIDCGHIFPAVDLPAKMTTEDFKKQGTRARAGLSETVISADLVSMEVAKDDPLKLPLVAPASRSSPFSKRTSNPPSSCLLPESLIVEPENPARRNTDVLVSDHTDTEALSAAMSDVDSSQHSADFPSSNPTAVVRPSFNIFAGSMSLESDTTQLMHAYSAKPGIGGSGSSQIMMKALDYPPKPALPPLSFHSPRSELQRHASSFADRGDIRTRIAWEQRIAGDLEGHFTGLEVTTTPPHSVLAIYDLVDKNGLRQGTQNYGNEHVEVGDRLLAVDGKPVEHIPVEALHGETVHLFILLSPCSISNTRKPQFPDS